MKQLIMFVTIAVLFLGGSARANTEPAAGTTQVRDTDGATMVYVPSGEFLMGSAVSEIDSNEWPQHIVYIDGFWIDRTEVTNRQFEQFVAATGYRTEAENEGRGGLFDGYYPIFVSAKGVDWRHPEGTDSNLDGCEECPVVQVSWNDAQAYCQWAGGRLPTEAEWEKAACGVDDRRYPWGNEKPNCRLATMTDSHDENCGQEKKPGPVGSKPAGSSPYGALDMAGSVWEPVADWYGENYYGDSPASNPQGPDSGDKVIWRGGSFVPLDSEQDWLRCTHRGRDPKTMRGNPGGIRCAMSAPTAAVPAEITAMPAISEPTSRVLFIGDSDVRFLDRYLPRFAASGEPFTTIESKAFASEGMWLSFYYMQGKYTLQAIESGQWKVVVLQQDLERTWQIAKTFCAYVGKFHKVATTAGAETVFFLPWDDPATPSPTLQEIADVSTTCGTELGVKVAPVGLAVERAIRERPTLSLFLSNGHANLRGVYLTVCVLYTTLFEQNPVGVAYRMDDVAAWSLEYVTWGLGRESNWQISAEDASFLQRIAWETVQAYQARPSAGQ